MDLLRKVYIAVAVFLALGFLLALGGAQFAGVNIGVVMLGIAIAYTILSIGIIGAEETGALFILEEPVRDLNRGPYFAPFGLSRVWRGPGTLFEDELPAPPEKIFKGDEKKEPVPEGMFVPIRIKFGPPRRTDPPRLKEDPYNIQMVVEVVPVVVWEISSGTKFSMGLGTIENARKVMEDKAISVFGDKFTRMTPARAQLDLRATSEALQATLKKEFKAYGVRIKDAYVKPFTFSHDLNKAVVNVSTQRENAKATRIASEAEKDKLINVGTGTAEAELRMLTARAEGVQKMAEVGKTPHGEKALYLEAMSKAFSTANHTIVPGGELFGAMFTGKEIFDRLPKKKEE